jgi:hypothetical protein
MGTVKWVLEGELASAAGLTELHGAMHMPPGPTQE